MKNKNNGLYRIAWQSRVTGYKGHGEFCFDDRELIVKYVKQLNNKYPDMKHWVERNPEYPLPEGLEGVVMAEI